MDHTRDFLNCIRSRKPTAGNPDMMFKSMSICLAADICGKLRRDVTFDLVKSEFIGDAEANNLRERVMRGPYIF